MPKLEKAISPKTETSKYETSKIDSWNAKTPKFRESQIRYYHQIEYFPAALKKKKQLFKREKNEEDEQPYLAVF